MKNFFEMMSDLLTYTVSIKRDEWEKTDCRFRSRELDILRLTDLRKVQDTMNKMKNGFSLHFPSKNIENFYAPFDNLYVFLLRICI
jgi:hypothetical protein